LIKKGTKVKALVLYNSFNCWGWLDTFPKKLLAKIKVIPGDIRDFNSVDKALEDTDLIFNLAALISIPFSYQSQDIYVDTNIKGTLNILQVSRRRKIKRIIHTSTSEVYGTAQYAPIDENHPINPQSPYAATKASADYLALSFYKTFNLPVTILRPFNTYGPRQSARSIIPTIITQALSGAKTLKLGSINTTRDFNYVTDTVDAFIKTAEVDTADGNIYNCASGREVYIKEMVETISKILGKRLTISCDKPRVRPAKSEVMRLIGDSSKLYNTSGWEPKVSLEQGLKLTCDWFKKNLNNYKPFIYNL
jgi:dTDP-glucose 4,6-dehydratase